MTAAPNPFAAIKAGDEVWIRRFGLLRRAKAERTTATQIIADGMRFRVKNGHEVGKSCYSSWFIELDLGMVSEIQRDNRRREALREFRKAVDANVRFTRDGIEAVRRAADAAEAVLRELGEWEA